MDEIMAAMVLTSLSCSPVVQSPPQRDLLPGELVSFANHTLPNTEHFAVYAWQTSADSLFNLVSF